MVMRYQLTPVEREVVIGFQDCYERWWRAELAARDAEAGPDTARAAQLRTEAQRELAAAIEFLRTHPI